MIKSIAIEPLKKQEYYKNVTPLTKKEVKKALDGAIQKISSALPMFTDKYPGPNSFGQVYEPIDNIEWTNGFWTGILWLAYEYTGDEKYKKAADIQVVSYADRIDKKIEVDHHDMGFLYTPSCVAAYKLTGNEMGKDSAIKAADQLISRYQEKGQFIQAWGKLGAEENYRLIIDCLLNIPLLYWASEVTKDKKYSDIATKHMVSSCNTVVRDDASAYHTFYFDPKTGAPVKGVTRQGFSDTSAWARGQAWGVYGLPLTYIYTKNPQLIDLYKGMTNYFLNRCPDDEVAYWDLIFGADDGHVRDSSASAIAVCGMLEMDKHLDANDPLKKAYLGASHAIMRELIDNYSTANNDPKSNGLLLEGVYSWHSKKGLEECNTWGDYFYMEALMRLYTDNEWELYW